jgi:hypothetical protein
MKVSLIWTVVCVISLILVARGSSAQAQAPKNDIYDNLLKNGVPLSNGQVYKLQEPVMPDGLKADEQDAILQKIGPKKRMADFLKGSKSDPFVLELNDLKGNPQQAIGRRVDMYYVAKGKLEWVTDPTFMKQQSNGANGQAVYLTPQELKERKLEVQPEGARFRDRYAHADFDLFGQVQVSGSGHGIETDGPDSMTVAYMLDPSFASDPKYPNQWQHIDLNPVGRKVFGTPEPYAGSGAYLKVTRLLTPPDRVFIEYHLVFDEPFGWFKGRDTLKSKLPNECDSEVKKFRGDLTDFGKRQATPAKPAPAPAANPPSGAK